MKKKRAKLRGQIRGVLIAGGGFVVGKGYVDEQTMMAAVGLIMAVGANAWSWFDPAKNIGEGDI